MNWDIAEGNWKQFQGKVKAQWGELTDDQLYFIAGRRMELAGQIQEAYGISRDEAEVQIKRFEESNED
ncbi:CsbD family protein [Uliginosibacterium sp. H1]|uniref:CsbD family protein n=1 Tax=Uliginosibacterium sp. H1 TaxID=3114757 RepID=UPI002E186B43|nr:CsbD family protein [Uliginosibacterium sp. H1]